MSANLKRATVITAENRGIYRYNLTRVRNLRTYTFVPIIMTYSHHPPAHTRFERFISSYYDYNNNIFLYIYIYSPLHCFARARALSPASPVAAAAAADDDDVLKTVRPVSN